MNHLLIKTLRPILTSAILAAGDGGVCKYYNMYFSGGAIKFPGR